MQSVLKEIIDRIQVMTLSGRKEVRHFELDGQTRCRVSYDPDLQEFQLEDSQTGNIFSFDLVDLVAIDVFELLG